MLFALFAAVFFALSTVFAHRTTRLVGSFTANFARLWLAVVFLAVVAWWQGGNALRGAALPVFVLSGVVGFGIGDLALFVAYPRLGSRLTSLLMQCLSAPFAAVIEWLWLGTRPGTVELLCGAAILAGAGLAIAPADAPTATSPAASSGRTVGIAFGLLAALGQGGGAVISRKAYAITHAAGQDLDGFTAAFQRALGGVVVISAAFAVSRWNVRRVGSEETPRWRAAWPWIVATALAGATFGVSCFQRALATTPSAVVLPIIALTPLIVVPLAYFMERERPTVRSLIGGALAVAAAVVLARVR